MTFLRNLQVCPRLTFQLLSFFLFLLHSRLQRWISVKRSHGRPATARQRACSAATSLRRHHPALCCRNQRIWHRSHVPAHHSGLNRCRWSLLHHRPVHLSRMLQPALHRRYRRQSRPCPPTNNASLAVMAALGPCSLHGSQYTLDPNSFININEVSTVASVYALAGFIDPATGKIGTSVTNSTGSPTPSRLPPTS